MPWEKTFDIDTAVDRATSVFWAKGYEATSLANLMSAIGITKGSFYNAFGSKKALFVQALLKYDTEGRATTLANLAAQADPIAAINILFDGLIERSLTDNEKKGCLLVNTALDLPNQDQDIAESVKKGFAEFENFFVQQIELGIRNQVIPQHIDANTAAKALVTLVVGLSVLARGVFDEESLQAIKAQALMLIGQTPPKK